MDFHTSVCYRLLAPASPRNPLGFTAVQAAVAADRDLQRAIIRPTLNFAVPTAAEQLLGASSGGERSAAGGLTGVTPAQQLTDAIGILNMRCLWHGLVWCLQQPSAQQDLQQLVAQLSEWLLEHGSQVGAAGCAASCVA